MAKETKIQPVVSESKKVLVEPVLDFHRPENYLVEMPDGTLQSVTPRTFRRAFENKDGITVKKSPNQ